MQHSTMNYSMYDSYEKEAIKITRSYLALIIMMVVLLSGVASSFAMYYLLNDRMSSIEASYLSMSQLYDEDTAVLKEEITKLKQDNADLKTRMTNAITDSIKAKEDLRKFKEETKDNAIKKITTSRGSVSRDFNVTSKSYVSAKELDYVLKGTGLAGLGSSYIEAERSTGVNAIFLLAISANESGWGSSTLSKTKNNIFGWQAYDSNVSAAKSFSSKKECILYVASKLKKNYLTEGGRYFKGYTASAVNKRYASDEEWSYKTAFHMKGIATKIQAYRDSQKR